MFVIPPNEYNSIFVMTNYIETYQREGKCDEVKIIYELNQIKMIKIILYNIKKKRMIQNDMLSVEQMMIAKIKHY